MEWEAYAKHMPSTCQAYSKHIPSICQAYSKHIPSICQAYSENIPNIGQACSKHNMTDVYSKHTRSLFQSYSKHMPSLLQACSNKQGFQELVVIGTVTHRNYLQGPTSTPFYLLFCLIANTFWATFAFPWGCPWGIQRPSSRGSFLKTLLGHKFNPFWSMGFLTNDSLQCWG